MNCVQDAAAVGVCLDTIEALICSSGSWQGCVQGGRIHRVGRRFLRPAAAADAIIDTTTATVNAPAALVQTILETLLERSVPPGYRSCLWRRDCGSNDSSKEGIDDGNGDGTCEDSQADHFRLSTNIQLCV